MYLARNNLTDFSGLSRATPTTDIAAILLDIEFRLHREAFISEVFILRIDSNYIHAYQGGNVSISPSARMLLNGYFFDPIARKNPDWKIYMDAVKDYKNHYILSSDFHVEYYRKESDKIYFETELVFGDCGLDNQQILLFDNPEMSRKMSKTILKHRAWMEDLFSALSTTSRQKFLYPIY